MARGSRRWWVGLAVGCMVIALLVFASMMGLPSARPQLPNPNGYNDLLAAAALVTGDVGDAASLQREGLRGLVATNAESLRLLRLGLSRRCALPEAAVMTNVPGMLTDLANCKRLAQLALAEGRLAEMEGRLGDAAQSYLDTMRLGNEMSRGGFIITRLVGAACEAMGETRLSNLVPKFNSVQAHRVLRDLEKIDGTAVSWSEVERNESRFVGYQFRAGQLRPLAWVLTRWQAWRARHAAEARHNRVVARRRLLLAELGVRAYQAEQGRVPGVLAQLVPHYLHQVPLDPFSGKPIIYRPQGSTWLLYSVGQDQVDDGGKPVGKGLSAKGDIFYDSPW